MASEFPADFVVPKAKRFETFQLRAIQPDDASADYEAVMESRVRLRDIFGGDWPGDGFTLEQNHADLEKHARDFSERKSFTYSIFSNESDWLLGCVYIVPGKNAKATVVFWIRDGAIESHPDTLVRKELEQWLENDWPIEFEFFSTN